MHRKLFAHSVKAADVISIILTVPALIEVFRQQLALREIQLDELHSKRSAKLEAEGKLKWHNLPVVRQQMSERDGLCVWIRDWLKELEEMWLCFVHSPALHDTPTSPAPPLDTRAHAGTRPAWRVFSDACCSGVRAT